MSGTRGRQPRRALFWYAFCRALALAVFGQPRATLDIDLVGFAESTDDPGRAAGKLSSS